MRLRAETNQISDGVAVVVLPITSIRSTVAQRDAPHPADPAWRCRRRTPGSATRFGCAQQIGIAAFIMSAMASDSDISIAVWFATPMLQARTGSKPDVAFACATERRTVAAVAG